MAALAGETSNLFLAFAIVRFDTFFDLSQLSLKKDGEQPKCLGECISVDTQFDRYVSYVR